MLSKTKFVEKKLKDLIQNEVEDDESSYEWTENLQDINFWDFISLNFLQLDRFFTLLDIETGPNYGWEKFVETLGLYLWEDRKWCHQYHNGAGPTKVSLAKLLHDEKHDKSLTLTTVLEILKEMERYDILRQVNWQGLAKNFQARKNIPTTKQRSSCEILKLIRELESLNGKDLKPSKKDWSLNLKDTKKEELIPLQFKNKSKEKSNNLICILMVYASDAMEYANKVAEFLRREGVKDKKFKIVMIGDSNIKRVLVRDPSNTLHKWFNQVRYVVPVLSPQFLRQIQNLDSTEDEALYNRLIYRFALDQYVEFGSRNLRCRPICPPAFQDDVKNNAVVFGNGLLWVHWTCENEAEMMEFAKVLVDKPIRS